MFAFCYRWSDRRILDVEWGGAENMWVVLTSCLRVGPERRPATPPQAEESCTVSVQEAGRRGRSIVLEARGGAVGDGVVYVCLRGGNGSSASSGRVMALKLSDLVVPSADKQNIVTASSDLAHLAKWDVPQSSDSGSGGSGGPYPTPGAYVGIFKDAVYVVDPSSMLLIFDNKTGALQSSSQLSDSRMVSCNLGGMQSDGAVVFFCLTDRGNIHRVKCVPKK
jgi:hypothetical protein